jgi:hypothetical protein
LNGTEHNADNVAGDHRKVERGTDALEHDIVAKPGPPSLLRDNISHIIPATGIHGKRPLILIAPL